MEEKKKSNKDFYLSIVIALVVVVLVGATMHGEINRPYRQFLLENGEVVQCKRLSRQRYGIDLLDCRGGGSIINVPGIIRVEDVNQ